MEIRRINIGDISEIEYQKTSEFFPETAERIKNYRPYDKKRTIAGRYLLKQIIKELYGREEFTIAFNENGKPILDFCFFSISHSGDFAVCAVADMPVGVDIESIKGFKRRDKYMLFSERESQYVNECDCENRFYTLWTSKEAYLKAMGGVIADGAKTELVTPDFILKDKYEGFELTTEITDEYVLSILK